MLDYDNTTYKQVFGRWEGGLFAQILLHHAKYLRKGTIRNDIGKINLPNSHGKIRNVQLSCNFLWQSKN